MSRPWSDGDNRDQGSESVAIGRDKSERFARQLKDSLRDAKKEEDVRLATYGFLRSLSTELGINVRLMNERVVVSGGRIDSLFDNVIFEFKDPHHFRTKAGRDEAVIGRGSGDSRKGGLVEYLISLAIEESTTLDDFLRHLSAKVGVGFDGESFIYVRYVAVGEKEVPLDELRKRMKNVPPWLPNQFDGLFSQTVQPDMKAGLRFLYLCLRAISPRDPLKPANVSKRFGEHSEHFRKHLNVLYAQLWKALEAKEPHITTLYGEWNLVFGKVYGNIGTSTTEITSELLQTYGDAIDFDSNGGLDLQRLIFTIHTYYSIILKFLVSELLQSLLNPFSRRSTALALTDEKFYQRLKATMEGDYFKLMNIENFFELGFFEWWLHAWNEEMSSVLREVIQLMGELEVTTSVIKPELIGDTVKETYHSLMPKPLRHLLGEYFTPDWLAEYAIELSGYSGGLSETFLDPACGSGTFITIAIKKKYSTNPEADRTALVKNILSTVVGFDLNPISAIASKTNYLLTLGDLEGLPFIVKIPVFQCDSILTPTVHAKQKENAKVFQIETICGKFIVPAFNTRTEVEDLLDIVKVSMRNGLTSDEYLAKAIAFKKDIDAKAAVKLYKKVTALDINHRDGFWIPILKNAFAPVYSRSQFDYVVGNPPWVSWRSMSKSYRELTLPIWLSYDIFNKSAYDKATTHDDFAMAFTYVSADHYLRSTGKLCFVISQAFFKSSKGGEGFRKFRITRSGIDVPLKVEKVVDMVAVKPFKEVTNRTAVMLIKKGEETTYPVKYEVWDADQRFEESAPLGLVLRNIHRKQLGANPIKGTKTQVGFRSPWLTLPEDWKLDTSIFLGKSEYRGRKGVEPLGAKGVYVLKKPIEVAGNKALIVNDLSRGRLEEIDKIGEHEGRIENDFVYPMVSGRNLDRYGMNSVSYVLLPHQNRKGPHNGVPESVLKVEYTDTYEWLKYWKEILLETRERNSKFYEAKLDPFYALDNVGTYTFSPFKVAWREQNKEMVACVLSTKPDAPLLGKIIIPDSKVLFCPLYDENEAHYLCAVLNSKAVTDIIEGYTIELQRGIDIFDNIKIPKYDSTSSLCVELAKLSKEAHGLVSSGKDTLAIQSRIDAAALQLFKVQTQPVTLSEFE